MSDLKKAVVLSGGGAYGAYEIGVLKALCNGRSSGSDEALDPHVFCGTSIGSFNSSYLVSKWDTFGAAAIGELEDIWMSQICAAQPGLGGYRIRLNPIDLLNPLSYAPNPLRTLSQFTRDSIFMGSSISRRIAKAVSNPNDPLLERIIDLFNLADLVSTDPWARVVNGIDFESVRKSSKELRVVTTNWNKGKVRIFKNMQMSEDFGPKVILASSAIPGFFASIFIGSQQFVDGGVLMNTPMKPAIRAGSDEIHVIFMHSRIIDIPLSELASTMDTVYRQQLVAWADAHNRDIERARAYNRALDFIEHGDINRIANPSLKNLITTMKQSSQINKEGRTYKKLTIHRYFPREPLGDILGLLNLKPERIRSLIDLGFNDAVYHDCQESGCVLADEPYDAWAVA